MPLDADQVLMKRFQEGDNAAFEVLVHKYQGMVHALARRYMGSRFAGIDDVAQKVFIRMFRSKMTYTPKAKVKTWLYSVTVNACLNEIRHLRAAKNRRVGTFTAVFGDQETPSLPDTAQVSPSSGLEADEVNSRVRTAVDGLPEQQRLALVLSRFHNCSYEEIAETLETTIPAVKSLLTRARANLRTALGDLVERMPDPAAAKGNS